MGFSRIADVPTLLGSEMCASHRYGTSRALSLYPEGDHCSMDNVAQMTQLATILRLLEGEWTSSHIALILNCCGGPQALPKCKGPLTRLDVARPCAPAATPTCIPAARGARGSRGNLTRREDGIDASQRAWARKGHVRESRAFLKAA